MGERIPYVVCQGDYLTGIALRRGFDAQEVWQHPSNDDLRRRRPNPEVLAPGDILHVPDRAPDALSVVAGTSNKFSASLPTVKIELSLEGESGKPLANKRCWVDGKEAGSTDGDGKIGIDVRATQASVSLRVEGSADVHLLRLGHLDPIDTDAGVRQRLANLRHLAEGSASVTEEQLADALRRFQKQMGLAITGVPDDETRKRLVSEYGS